MKKIHRVLPALLAALLAAGAAQAQAQARAATTQPVPGAVDAALRKTLEDKVGKVDEIRRAPLAGLYEVRVGTDLFYVDAEGSYLINGQLFDLRTRQNLTQERLDQLLAVAFDELPAKDAFVVVRGNGKRKMAVFADPNCGYCKRLEADLLKVDNVTVHTYLIPILSPDSADKSRNIWCAKDKGKAWLDWMVRNVPAPKADASCDVAALQRNLQFARRYNIAATPTMFFADGKRVPGAISVAEVEKNLARK